MFWVEAARLQVRSCGGSLGAVWRTECFLSCAVKHDWEKMTESVQNYIGSLNWGYRVALREKKVVYENAYGRFIGPHKIKVSVKLHSILLPCFFKTVFIGVGRENHV